MISLLGSALFAASLGPALASSGSGSGGDDIDDAIEDIDDDYDHDFDVDDIDHSGNDNENDNSGPSGDDDEDRSGSNSGSSHDDNDDDNSGSGHASFDDEGRAAAGELLYAVTESFDGEEVLEREYLWEASDRAVREARRAGFSLVSRTQLEALDVHLVRLRAPERMSNARALTLLRRLAPGAIVTPHHVYRVTGAVASSVGVLSASPTRSGGVIGVIDTGVEQTHLANAGALLSHHGADGRPARPREHGSAVAAIAIAHGARVHVVDVFGDSRDGSQVAPAAAIAQAIDWMVAQGIPVINISVQGPNNPVLNDIIRRASARGHIIVAAAGNNGPYAQPSFPAAFEGAVAVTAIDTEDRPYMRANRGSYIDFAAEGVEVPVQLNGRTLTVTGTSFAAPIVAAQLSHRLRTPSPEQAASAIGALRDGVTDLGAPGHDPVYGWGAVPD
jgi:hypothetical protein